MALKSNQRRGQAWMASQKILAAAEKIAAERGGLSKDEAIAAVFADRKLLAECHGVPRAENIARDWREPE